MPLLRLGRARRKAVVLAISLTACSRGEPEPGCRAPADCPAPAGPCAVAACASGACTTEPVPAGARAPDPVPGDCAALQCDGNGGTVAVTDDTDLPVDGNPCTEDHCTDGVAWWSSLAAGTPCGQGLLCDGNDACVGCLVDSDCPATAGECAVAVCSAGTCTFAPVSEGTIVSQQTPGDCHQNRCDGQGHVVAVIDDADVPSDGTVCTLDVCSGGVPSNPPASIGTPCAENGGAICDGSGTCVPGCRNGSDCPSGVCIDWVCVESTCSQRRCFSSSDCCLGYYCGANGCVAYPSAP